MELFNDNKKIRLMPYDEENKKLSSDICYALMDVLKMLNHPMMILEKDKKG